MIYCHLMQLIVFSLLILMSLEVEASIRIDDDTNDDRKTHYNEHGELVVPISDQHLVDLYTRWVEQSLSSVISVLATKELKEVPELERDEFASCSKRAQNVHSHARCLNKLWAKNAHQYQKFRRRHPKLKYLKSRLTRYSQNQQWVGPFKTRQKRWINIKSATGYTLKGSKHEGSSPLGYVARGLLKAVLLSKNRTRTTRWQEVVEQAQQIQQQKDDFNQRHDTLNSNPTNKKQALFRDLNRLNSHVANDLPIDSTNDFSLSNSLAPNSNDHFVNRIFDFKQDLPNDQAPIIGRNDEDLSASKLSQRVVNFVQDGVKLGYSLAGANSTELEQKKSMRLISPRFLSVVPEHSNQDNKTLEFMSPSLFSLHSNGQGIENLTSLPNLFKEFTGEDQQAWLDLIVESAGVNEHLQKLEGHFQTTEMSPNAKLLKDSLQKYKDAAFTKDGKPLYFTKENVTRIYGKFGERRIDHWMDLQKTFTNDQIRQLNTTGLVAMTPDQLEFVYGHSSPFNDTKSLKRLHSFMSNATQSEIDQQIRKDLKVLASADNIKIRRKRDIVLSPVSFTVIANGVSINEPFILSPLFFAPLINQVTILGPLILSPWVFVPLVLSPKLLSPIIVSPFLFSPTILSPYVLHPTILSPGAFNPFILTPVVLGPGILSPQAFSPQILAPAVLSPVILLPAVGSPKVLSPFVLSPTILSPQALSALVLSPYALSPVIFSRLIAFALVLSPSWLS